MICSLVYPIPALNARIFINTATKESIAEALSMNASGYRERSIKRFLMQREYAMHAGPR
jgi:hypothetical protein